MSFIPKDYDEEMKQQFKKIKISSKDSKEAETEEEEKEEKKLNEDPFQARINTNNTINKPVITINEIVDENSFLEDIDSFFSEDEQFELVNKGIKLTTSKQYKKQTGKSPIWRGNITNGFKIWIQKNHPEEIKFFNEKTKTADTEEKTFIKPNEIQEKIKRSQETEKRILEMFTTDERNELLDCGIQFHDAVDYYDNTNNKPIINGEITQEFKEFLKKNNKDSLKYLIETEDIKEAIEEVKKSEEKSRPVIAKEKKLVITPTIIKTETLTETSVIKPKPVITKIKSQQSIKPKPIPETKINISEIKKESNSEMIIQEEQESLPIQKFETKPYPTDTEILFLINRHKFVKEKLLDSNDIITIKRNKFVKKSGWRKFINAFGISIELIEQKVYEQFGDKHAEIRVRAIAPNGQSVEGIGIKSWSELYDKNMHNLIATAWTRAVNRAVSDLVGYGEVSAEELNEENEEKKVL